MASEPPHNTNRSIIPGELPDLVSSYRNFRPIIDSHDVPMGVSGDAYGYHAGRWIAGDNSFSSTGLPELVFAQRMPRPLTTHSSPWPGGPVIRHPAGFVVAWPSGPVIDESITAWITRTGRRPQSDRTARTGRRPPSDSDVVADDDSDDDDSDRETTDSVDDEEGNGAIHNSHRSNSRSHADPNIVIARAA